MAINGFSQENSSDSCFSVEQRNIAYNKSVASPRPLERQLTNIIMTTSSQYNQGPLSSVRSKDTVMNIVLNAPFIKLNRDDVKTSIYRDRKPSDLVEAPPPVSPPESPPATKVRVAPSRLCKGRPLVPAPVQNVEFRRRNSSSNKRKRLRGGVKVSRHRPSRASIRLYHKQKQIIDKFANRPKSKCLRVSRTVELVNQTTDAWRDQKSKLLYMLSLGLTPIANKPRANISPFIKLTRADPCIVAQIQARYEAERLLRRQQERERIARRRLQIKQHIRFLNAHKKPVASTKPVEIIDLASDDDDEKQECEDALSIFYPKITLSETKPADIHSPVKVNENNKFTHYAPPIRSASSPSKCKSRLKVWKPQESWVHVGFSRNKQIYKSIQPHFIKGHHHKNDLSTPTRLPIQKLIRTKSKVESPRKKYGIDIVSSPPMKVGKRELEEFSQRFKRVFCNPKGVVSCTVKPIQESKPKPVSNSHEEDDDVILID